MARRLDPETRRAEIVQITYEMIAEDGPQGLSMRAVARRCGMSAPGLMYHFPDLTSLLTEVLKERRRREHAAIPALAAEQLDDITLPELADSLVFLYTSHEQETHNFDLLEAEAFSSGHPAHGLYPRSGVQPLPITRYLAERDYEDPERVVTIIGLTVDGFRLRWLRTGLEGDMWSEWLKIREHVFGCFTPKKEKGPRSAPPGSDGDGPGAPEDATQAP